MEIFLLIVILILAGYIAYLHTKLIKRDLQFESLLKKMVVSESPAKYDELRSEKILDEDVMKFMLEYEDRAKIYLHYTKFKSDAENILKEGFRFAESFYKTAFSVTSDRLDLLVKHNSKRYYGDYVIVICISDRIIKYYNDEIAKAGIKNCNYENILTERPPEKNDNADTVYVLPSKYIKGIINHRTGEIIKNPDFDPDYSSPWFEINIEKMKTINQ
ncbi:MAG TPA: hypothetical protein P5320_02615 [Bacteroidales bacterium]|nr:hypothetical protein [Bacteroidales bacterium]HOK74360.1 hypothetical protein [Bacteroidales bacterium]HPP92104.1 hypothetical protein [Bacteroidales bacterium]HQK70021.1 hypothetical protein [Bacteroidales bacterium]HRR15589.1 hypothetical protein [Bacteroidales bacterium]